MHWPGASLFLVISPLFPFLDIFIQMLRKKEDKVFRILSSLAMFGISFFILFKMLHWFGSSFVMIFSIICCIPLLVITIKKGFKQFKGYRRIILTVLILFSAFIFSLSPSQFQLAFMIEDPFDQNEMVPPFVRHKLAFNLYHEGQKEKALALLKITLKDLERNCLEFSPEIVCELNKAHVHSDMQAAKTNTWNYMSALDY